MVRERCTHPSNDSKRSGLRISIIPVESASPPSGDGGYRKRAQSVCAYSVDGTFWNGARMTANDLDCESPSFLSNQHVHHLAMVATASVRNRCAQSVCAYSVDRPFGGWHLLKWRVLAIQRGRATSLEQSSTILLVQRTDHSHQQYLWEILTMRKGEIPLWTAVSGQFLDQGKVFGQRRVDANVVPKGSKINENPLRPKRWHSVTDAMLRLGYRFFHQPLNRL
jgi:hypothetical protein